MAERRMFAKTIVLSDAFLDMPLSARCLYFTLGMLADDDGFVNAPRSVMRQCGASDDDMKLLIAKKFILSFDSGVIAIKHWRVNNYLRSDRYVQTKYIDEKATLSVDESGIYHAGIPTGIPSNGLPSIGKDRKDKESIDKDSIRSIAPKKSEFSTGFSTGRHGKTPCKQGVCSHSLRENPFLSTSCGKLFWFTEHR